MALSYTSNYVRDINQKLSVSYKYGDGFPVLKELIQNADDAGASELRIYIVDGIREAKTSLLRQPAIIIYNDGEFKEEHLNNILTISVDSKTTDKSKIGRYGLGMKSIFHICDAFIFAICKKPDFPDIKVDCISPWAPNDKDHDYLNFPTDEERLLIIKNIPFDLKKENGFVLYLPIQEPGKQHVIQEHKISKDKPFGIIEDVLNNIGTTLPLLCEVSPSKTLKIVKYYVSLKDCKTVTVDNKKKIIEIDNTAKKRKEHYCVYNADISNETINKFKALTENENWNQREEKKDVKPEITFELIRNENDKKELNFKYCVYLPMEEPKISPVKVNTRNGFTVLVHGNFAIDSGRRGFIGFSTLLNKQEDTVIEGTESLQIMWNKILAQEIMFPEFPKFLQNCIDEELLICNKSTDEVSEFLNTFNSIQFGAIPFINQYTCTNYYFGKVVKFNKGKTEVSWQCFDSHKKIIKLPEVSDFTKVLEVLPSLEKQDCVYISHNYDQHQVLPNEYDPDTIIIQNIINSLTEKAIKDVNYCKWLRSFLSLNEKAFVNNESLIKVIILIIKRNLLKCSLSDLTGNSKNLGELLTYINKLSGVSCKKFFAVNIKEENKWFDIWNDNQEFVLVPSFLTVEENYISDDYIYPICNYLETSNSIPTDNHYDILQRILGKKRFEESFQTISENFKSLALFKIQNIKITNKEEFVTKEKLNTLVEHGLLFYYSSDFKENAPIKLYAKLIDSLDIYFIAKTSFFKDEGILSPNEEQAPNEEPAILKSFQKQDFKNIEYDKKFLAEFLEKMFEYTFPISTEAAPFYRFLFSNCNKKLKDETICFNNNEEVWKRIFKAIKPDTIFIPDNLQEHTKRQILENKEVLNIIPLNAESCLKELNTAFNLSFFKNDEYFLDEKVHEILFRQFQKSNEELYLRIPLQFDTITKQYVAPKDNNCYLNLNGIKIPNGLKPDFFLIEPSSNDILLSKQKEFLDKLEYKKAFEKFVALGTKDNIDIYEEAFSILTKIENYEEFSDPSNCSCALVKWIPLRTGEKCSARQIIADNIFSESITNFLTSNFALYNKDELALSDDKFIKMQAKKMFPDTYEKLFDCFEEPFSEKLLFKVQFDTFEEFNSGCNILRNFETVPVYGALSKLLDNCKSDNSRELLFNLYKKLEVNSSLEDQIKALDNCLEYVTSVPVTNSLEKIYIKLLEKVIKIQSNDFDISRYKYLTQNNLWKSAAEIAATDDQDYDSSYLLKKSIYDLLKTNGVIHIEQEQQETISSDLEDTISGDASFEEIEKTFSPWFQSESLEKPKLIYLLLLLLQGNFSEYVLTKEKNITDFDTFIKEYQKKTVTDDKKYWINNVSEANVFTSFNHFKTIVHIPKGTVIPLTNLINEEIPVPQANSENPDTLYSENAGIPIMPRNIFHLRLKKITSTVQDLDTKLQDLILSQVLRFAFLLWTADGELEKKMLSQFLKTNQNTVNATVLYIFDSLFDKLSGMGLKSNKDFKSLYTQYSELFNRQISLENTNFQSYEVDKKNQIQTKINDDKNNLNKELKNLILTNKDVQKDIHAAVKYQIKKDQYSVSRILYELLQNADDAVCDISDDPRFKDRRSFSVIVSDKTFVVSHYGRRINETPTGSGNSDKYQYDLKNMLVLNASDKDDGDTGQFGLGFKSIYIASNEPTIRSGELQFKIIAALYPKKVDTEVKLNDFETRIEFNLTEDNYSVSDVLADFSRTAAIQPLLCRGINEISIQMNSDGVERRNTYCVKVLKEILNTSFGKIELVNLDGQNYFVIEGNNNLYKIIMKETDKQVDIFKSSSKENMPRIWNLAPFAEYENLPFIINANFDLDPGRTSLSKVDNKNKILLDNISDSISQLLCKLYEGDNYNIGLLESLLNVFLITTNSPEQLFAEFAKRILKSVSGEKNIIPTGTNRIIPVCDTICAITANNFGLRPDDISFVTVLNLIQKIFGDQRYIVSNTVNDVFGKKWVIIDSYVSILQFFSKLHDSVLDNECLKTFLEILKNTDHSEDINWSLFNIRNKDGIPKPINSFTFTSTKSNKFEIISEEYDDDIIEYFKRQEFAKNNVISERESTIAIQSDKIAMQDESIQSLRSKVNTLEEVIKSRDFGNLDTLIDNYNFTDDSSYNPDLPRCTVMDVYNKWKAAVDSNTWNLEKQDYYNRVFPTSLADTNSRKKSLAISTDFFENYTEERKTMPESWCTLFMLGSLQSINYYGEQRTEVSRKEKMESMSGLIKEFSDGETLDKLYDHYLDSHTTDEDDLLEFESLLRVYKFRRQFIDVWSKLHGLQYSKDISKESLVNASASAETTGKALKDYCSKKTLKFGISLIVRELLDSDFYGTTEEERDKAFDILNKFTYMPHAYLRRIVFNDWGERVPETTSEAIHYAILDALRAEALSEEEIRAFMKCHDLPFLIFGEKK